MKMVMGSMELEEGVWLSIKQWEFGYVLEGRNYGGEQAKGMHYQCRLRRGGGRVGGRGAVE